MHDANAQIAQVPEDAAVPSEYHVYHDPDGDAKVSTTLIHALAEVMDEDITDTQFTLHEYVDPDALDWLFAPVDEDDDSPPGHVAFTVEGYRVTVYSSGEIVITPPEPPRAGGTSHERRR